MSPRALLVVANVALVTLAAGFVPAGAQPLGSTDRFAAMRSFVRDSTARVRASTLGGQVVSTRPNLAAAQLVPVATAGQLAAREIRVGRVSDLAGQPRLANPRQLLWKVPLQIQARDQQGATHTLLPRMELDGRGLAWDRTLERYIGRVRVWLEDEAAPATGYALEAPVALEVGGEASDYDPTRWDVSRAGRPSQDVKITVAGARERDTIEIKVAATSSAQQVALENATAAIKMPLTGEPMRVEPARQSVQGWGLEAAELTITTSPSAPGRSHTVSVTSARGMTRAQPLEIGPNGVAIARIRSGAPGLDTVWVNLENEYRRYALVEHKAPWIFLLFAIGGGLVGSFLRTLGRSTGRAKHPGRARMVHVIVGVLCGLLSTGLYHVGFPILPAIATGQPGGIVAAVVAAVGAFLGRDWLAGVLKEH